MATRLTRDDIIAWANTNAARGLLPQLMHRLIAVSGASVDQLAMPFGDSVGRSGLDGFVVASAGASFVPAGESVWEMGVDRIPKKKADKDYAKRDANTAATRKKKTTYVQVTPRHWEKKAQWITDRERDGWKKVIVYDVDDLLGVLDRSPAVDAWLSRLIGKPTAGLRDCEGYWKNISTGSDFSIQTSVLLAGRDELAAEVRRYAETPGTAQPFALTSRSPMEVLSFSVASICSTNDQKLLSRSVVVERRDQWERVVVEERNLVLVLSHTVQPTMEELLQSKGSEHKVIHAGHFSSNELPRLDQFELEKALFDSGAGDVNAAQLARRSRGSDIVLLDSLHRLEDSIGAPMSQLPDRIKAALLCLGGWDGRCYGDRQVVEWLCGDSYDQISAQILADASDPSGMLFTADEKFRLLAPERAWRRFSHLVTGQLVDNYRDLIELALTDDDPIAELSGTDRWMAQFRGEKQEFSDSLRRYTLDSLALAASLPHSLNRSDIDSEFFDGVVRSVLDQASIRRWISLGRQLPMLAEVSPTAVLEAIESGLQLDGTFRRLFAGGECDSFSGAPHAGVLWALERMAWSPLLLSRVCSILVRLDGISGDLKVTNTPGNSFTETLSVYLPQTAADTNDRRQTIQQLLQNGPANTWGLVLSLLPNSKRFRMVRSKPLWRDWAQGWSRHRQTCNLREEIVWLVDQIVGHVGDSCDRCIQVLNLYDKIPSNTYVKFVDAMRSRVADIGWSEDECRRLWETINLITVRLDFLTRELAEEDESCVVANSPGNPQPKPNVRAHARYARLRAEICDGLVGLQNLVRPSDPASAAVYAFRIGHGTKHFARHFERSADHRLNDRQMTEARLRLIREVFTDSGFDGIRRLASHPEVHSASVGVSAAKALDSIQLRPPTLLPLLDSAVQAEVDLASGFLQGRDIGLNTDSALSAMELLKACQTDSQKLGILLSLRNESKTWDIVDDQIEPIVERYWQRVEVAWSVPVEQMPRLVRQLIVSGRTLEAIDRIGHLVHSEDWDWRGLILECFEALTSPIEKSSPASNLQLNIRWKLQQLFKYLYSEEPEDFNELQTLVGYEFAFVSIFGDDSGECLQPLGFVRLCATHPNVFIETIAAFSRNDADVYMFDPTTDGNLVRARQCRELVGSMVAFPGYGAAEVLGCVKYDAATWVAAVLEHATAEKYRGAITDQLAEIFTRGAVAEIEDWPNKSLAAAINLITSKAGRSHLIRSLQNDRGFHWVDCSGKENREIAVKFRRRATKVDAYCPAAAEALCAYAAMLEREAKRLVEEKRWGQD